MLADIIRRFGLATARLVTAAFAVVAIAWTFSVVPVFFSQAAVTEAAAHIMAGETYRPAAMETLTAAIDRDQNLVARGSYPSKIAIVRLRNIENAINASAGGTVGKNMTALAEAINLSLANSPADPFLWMVRFWVETTMSGVTPDRLRQLRMSYQLGPREAWIAIKRNPLVLTQYSRLPPDLAEQVLAEFTSMVRSGLYDQAADALAGPGWPLRKQLMAQLTDIPLRDRQLLARALSSKDTEGDVQVPGVNLPPRPFR